MGATAARSKFNGLNLRQMQSIGDDGVDEDSDEDQVKKEVAEILSPLPKAN